MTWNAGATTPYHLNQAEQDKRFFPDLLTGSNSPDILVFGFQELVDLEDKKTTASTCYFIPSSAFQCLLLPRKFFQIQEKGSFGARAHEPPVS
jgi:hypothetical protein